MTRDELLETLVELRDSEPYDPERVHILADAMLLVYINDDEIREAFKAIEKWYS